MDNNRRLLLEDAKKGNLDAIRAFAARTCRDRRHSWSFVSGSHYHLADEFALVQQLREVFPDVVVETMTDKCIVCHTSQTRVVVSNVDRTSDGTWVNRVRLVEFVL